MIIDMAAPVLPLVTADPRRKKFTRAEAKRLVEAGLLSGRHELIDGDLIDKMGQNPPHSHGIQQLLAWLGTFLALERIRVQLPVDVAPEDQARNEPEPDLAVTALDFTDGWVRHPSAHELDLVVVVADSTAQFDLGAKASLYARAAVPEYWVLDLNRRLLIVHRHPKSSAWGRIEQIGEHEVAFYSGHSILVESLLSPPA
jgi:Uma2 family endonuclease